VAFPSPSDDARPAAVPPHRREPELAPRTEREGLSIQTLVIAAIASAAAAIVVSRLWDKGTIVASAMTPVVVAVISEMLRKPIESEVVRRPARAVGSVTASRRTWRRGEARPPSGRTPNVMAPPPTGVDEGLRHRDQGIEPGPVRVYSGRSSRGVPPLGARGRRRLKIAIVTGLVGFVVAAAALTLPELIFGGSVTGGKRDTTYFGGGGTSQAKDAAKDSGTKDGTSGRQTTTDEQQTTTETAPAQPGATTPGQTTPDPGSTTTTPPQSQTPPTTPPTPTTPPAQPVPTP
jgi:hypothetical protein